MKRMARLIRGGGLGAVIVVVLVPGLAYADNCSGLTDCYNTAQAALAALAALATLFGVLLSVGLDFMPGVGTVKGFIEAFTGRDLVTGQDLAWWERVLGIVPILGGVVGAAVGISKIANAADAVSDVARGVDKAGEAVDTASDLARAADKAGDTADAVGDASRAADKAADASDAARTPARLDESIAKHARPAEQRTAQRLADNPDFNGRTFKAPPPPDPGYDWVDDLGRTYDALGDGTKAKYFKLEQFTKSIDSHLLKSNNFTVIDMTGYTADQIADVKRYVDALPAAKQSLIIRVGF